MLDQIDINIKIYKAYRIKQNIFEIFMLNQIFQDTKGNIKKKKLIRLTFPKSKASVHQRDHEKQ